MTIYRYQFAAGESHFRTQCVLRFHESIGGAELNIQDIDKIFAIANTGTARPRIQNVSQITFSLSALVRIIFRSRSRTNSLDSRFLLAGPSQGRRGLSSQAPYESGQVRRMSQTRSLSSTRGLPFFTSAKNQLAFVARSAEYELRHVRPRPAIVGPVRSS